MKIKQLASNMTELQSGDTRILFSYETPVAAYIVNQGLYRTSKKWSVTTLNILANGIWLDGLTIPIKNRPKNGLTLY